MDSPAQGIVDTIGSQVMTPAKQGMDALQHLGGDKLTALLQALMRLRGGSEQPTAPAMASSGDIQLPPEGPVDPMLPAAHLPPAPQRMLIEELRRRAAMQPMSGGSTFGGR